MEKRRTLNTASLERKEYFDLFDFNNHPLNIRKERALVHKDGDWHRTSQIWLLNEKKEVLCNLRSAQKDTFPLHWDLSIGGHVVAGDNYEATALRELHEELGLNVSSDEVKYLSDEKTEGIDFNNNIIDKEHVRLFVYKTNRLIEEFDIQKEEIEEIRYYGISDLLKIIEEEKTDILKIVPTKKYLKKILLQLSLMP